MDTFFRDRRLLALSPVASVCNSAAVPSYRTLALSTSSSGYHSTTASGTRFVGRSRLLHSAVNAYSAEAGEPVVEPHDETSAGAGAHEELYLVVSGAATFTVAGKALDTPLGHWSQSSPG